MTESRRLTRTKNLYYCKNRRTVDLYQLPGSSVPGLKYLMGILSPELFHRLMKKVTMKTVQRIVGVMLILLAIGLGTGII